MWRSRATYDWVEQPLRAMLARAEAENIGVIAIPRFGTGYGGLSWKKLRPLWPQFRGETSR
jgi:O-acetyl-ADP-ribose deacetylase (regulator of RNase III)